MLTKEEASKELGISVRTLQRLTENKELSKTLKRGKSGKLEAFYDVEEIAKYKQERDTPTLVPALATKGDAILARSDIQQQQFLEVFRQAIISEQKPSVAIADKPLLKLDEASALTGLSRDLLRKSIDDGKLKGKIIGRAYRIKRADLDNFIENL
jgi:excisionase family DNA binding protein